MPLINQSYPNLVQGVSQQPPVNRFTGQAERQVNAMSSVVDGLSKRPHTNFVANLSTTLDNDALVHFFDRSDNEKYVITIDDNYLKVFNVDGTPCSIDGSTSGKFIGSNQYFNTTGRVPREDYKALTVGDTTFLVNKKKTVTAFSSTTPALEQTAVVTITQGDYKKRYKLEATVTLSDGTTATCKAFFRSGGSNDNKNYNANSEEIARGLKVELDRTTAEPSNWNGDYSTLNASGAASSTNDNASTGDWTTYFSIQQPSQGNNIYLELINGVDFTIKTEDSLSNTGMSVAYKEVDSIVDLPQTNKHGFKIKIRGSAEANEDDYYVEFESHTGEQYSQGTYKETVAPNVSRGLTDNSMPHKLVCTAENTFTLSAGDYTERASGDDDTNPHPSFKDKVLTNIFFFKNRLGFLCEDKIIMSEAGEPFNFYRNTVTTVLDSDPIDVQVSSQKVTNLKSAVGFQENLIVFSENSQFVLKGGDLLTPKTVSVTPVTNFDASAKVNPIPLGAYLYFPVEGTNFTSIREYTVNASTDVYDSTDITEHVPAYIPSNVTMFAGTSTKDALAVVSESEKNAIYVYRFFFNGQKKLLSSWFKFELDGDIRGMGFSKSDLFIVINKQNHNLLVSMPFNENLKDKDASGSHSSTANHNTYLDYRYPVTVSAGATSSSLPYWLGTSTGVHAYTDDGSRISGSHGNNVFNYSSAITADQAGTVWIGKPFTMTYEFSEIVFKDQVGNNQSPSNSSKLMLKNGTIFYADTKNFTVTVEPSSKADRDTQTDSFSADAVDSTVLGNVAGLETGKYRFPIFSDATDTKITITDSSIFNVKITSAEFEGVVKPRSKRIG